MTIYSTYKVKILYYSHIFADTARIYRAALDFLTGVCVDHWSDISAITNAKQRMMYVESLCHATTNRPVVEYDFDTHFYKFPSYLRRAAINDAIGMVSSYESNLANWKALRPGERGKAPTVPQAGFAFPAMYKDNCYIRIDNYTAKIKVFIRNTWDWLTVQLRKSDADYIFHHCQERRECVPSLVKTGKRWFLAFPFEEEAALQNVSVEQQIAVCVDLDVNNAATCSVMCADGTIVGRHFLSLPAEYDCLQRKLNRIVYAQTHGARRCGTLWALASGANDDIAAKTAQFIIDVAVKYNADVIVFEHLDVGGKKRGTKKQTLHLWKARAVQSIVTDKAHRLCTRISRINAWNTSRLAFDGSGRVLRGKESERTNENYSLCEFTTGKVYNCDLNASYNIGARYFIREILKSLPVTERQRVEAKVPACVKRSTCTLSTLISLRTELQAAA